MARSRRQGPRHLRLGHWLHAEKPVLFNKLVVDFLSTGG
jgi:pimeloyl-ACP methyl ester carboxylesterase